VQPLVHLRYKIIQPIKVRKAYSRIVSVNKYILTEPFGQC
jgi:hypothetical protein